MAYLTEAELRRKFRLTTDSLQVTASAILKEATTTTFDVFLSHSSKEPEPILAGIKIYLEEAGFSVYVDKYTDPLIAEDGVTKRTASILRRRMRQSKSLLYVHSRFSKSSRWMPWELGFFDGHKGKVGVLPVTLQQEELFKGEEYLNLYPYVDVTEHNGSKYYWIHKSRHEWLGFGKWIGGQDFPK